jgi:hypothetical protein
VPIRIRHAAGAPGLALTLERPDGVVQGALCLGGSKMEDWGRMYQRLLLEGGGSYIPVAEAEAPQQYASLRVYPSAFPHCI